MAHKFWGGLLVEDLPFNYWNNNPKISIVISIYNCENKIELSISSIKNQNFLDFEIILVNDFLQIIHWKLLKK